MNWKTDLKLADLETTTAIEVVCKRCGLTRFETPAELRNDFKNAFLMKLNAVYCTDKFCRGGVRIALTHDDKNEGFVGGMA